MELYSRGGKFLGTVDYDRGQDVPAWCGVCTRGFDSYSDLRAHLLSRRKRLAPVVGGTVTFEEATMRCPGDAA